ncbi:hypothetical protein [Haloferula sp. BvORR071]|uniref:hypothetical protein n=1 Tax=Haloferula sp. BvORR071 TaxID=1396141 RepID=UPI0006992007|nr:hypothetical protein [Haloferula sp. BvORR071]
MKALLISMLLLAGLLAAAESPDASKPRTWTSNDGRAITGTYLRGNSQGVVVKREDGKEVTLPVRFLSVADQEFVEQLLATESKSKAPEEKPKGSMTYKLSAGSEKWPEDRRKRITEAMDAAVEFYNKTGNFKKALTANNSPGTPTADANWDGWINFGGSINRRTALHEIGHTLGIGTHSNWQANIKDGLWTGKHALEQLREFDGKEAVLHADKMHFWPYGLNFDNESSKENDVRHVLMVAAMRKDMGID